jgi:hypothetical protein
MLKANKIIWLSSAFLLSACATPPLKVDVTTTKPTVVIPEKPRPVQMAPIGLTVVTKQNFNDLQIAITKNPSSVFIVLQPEDYDNLVNNVGELRRYIDQQNAIILYYDKTVNAITDNATSHK